MTQSLLLLESECLYYRPWISQWLAGRKQDAPTSMSLKPDGPIRGGTNTTPLGGNQRLWRKNSLSQRLCVRDQGEPYSKPEFRLWST